MDALHQARDHGIPPDENAWQVQRRLDFLESRWREPEEGIWEVRGPRRHFTHSKMMAWAGLDRAIKSVDRFGLDGPVQRWRRLRRTIHDEVCARGYDADRNTFTQSYGSSDVDAVLLLLLAPVGLLPATDRRVEGTVTAIEQELCRDGFSHRYSTDRDAIVDGLPPGEGAFPSLYLLAG